jgi:hypothetical protein
MGGADSTASLGQGIEQQDRRCRWDDAGRCSEKRIPLTKGRTEHAAAGAAVFGQSWRRCPHGLKAWTIEIGIDAPEAHDDSAYIAHPNR